jgi:hypothetical protein
MRIKLFQNNDFFLKEKNIIANLKKVQTINNKRTYEYTIFIPINTDSKLLNKISYIKAYIVNNTVSSSKIQLGKNIYEKKSKFLGDIKERKFNNTLFKLSQNAKNVNSFKKNSIFIGKFDVKNRTNKLLKNKNTSQSLFMPVSISFDDDMLKKIKYAKNNDIFIKFNAYKKNNLKTNTNNYTFLHQDYITTYNIRECFADSVINNKSNQINTYKAKDSINNVSYDLYYKKQNQKRFTQLQNIVVRLKEKNILIDENLISNYKNSKIVLRPLLKINGNTYNNFKKEITIKSEKNNFKNNLNNTTNCYSRLKKFGDNFNKNALVIYFSNLNPDVSYVQLFKRKRYNFKKCENYKSIGFYNVGKTDGNNQLFKNFRYEDNEIQDGYTYDYYIEEHYQTKESKRNEKEITYVYNAPKEFVTITKIASSPNRITLSVDFKLTNFEQIFNLLDEKDIEIYKNDLSALRSLAGKITYIDVEKYNTATGITTLIESYFLKNKTNLNIDLAEPLTNKEIIYINPRMLSVTQFIASNKNASNKSDDNFQAAFASSLLQQKDNNSDVQSFIGNKYSNNAFLKRNIIVSDTSKPEETGDIFEIAGLSLNQKEDDNVLITHSTRKVKQVLSNVSFFKNELVKLDMTYFITIEGTMPAAAETIIFYYNFKKENKEIAKGHVDISQSKNRYILQITTQQNKNNIYYRILDKNKSVLLTNQIENENASKN